jgi:hypothetical protein
VQLQAAGNVAGELASSFCPLTRPNCLSCCFADAVGGFLSEDVSNLNFKLLAMSLVNSPSSNHRRQLLQAGSQDRIVVGYQVGGSHCICTRF